MLSRTILRGRSDLGVRHRVTSPQFLTWRGEDEPVWSCYSHETLNGAWKNDLIAFSITSLELDIRGSRMSPELIYGRRT